MNDLLFPGKNQAIHQLLEFFQIGNLLRYRSGLTVPQSSDRGLLDAYIHYYKNRLVEFENELMQVAETSTEETLDYYFNELTEQISWIEDQLTVSHLQRQIEEWNKAQLKAFEDSIATKEAQFVAAGGRYQYGHLQEYEASIPAFFMFGMVSPETNVKKIHYQYICIEDILDQIHLTFAEEYYDFIKEQALFFTGLVQKYEHKRRAGQLKAKAFSIRQLPPIVFLEGIIDIELIQKAGELLNQKPLLERVSLRYREGASNLDKLYKVLTTDNWETIPQKKLLLYDCDQEYRKDSSGHISRRTIPINTDHPIGKGIENLFPPETIEKVKAHNLSFFDIVESTGTRRGERFRETTTTIAKEEKRNFCNYMLDHGTDADFRYFGVIFAIIESLLELN